MTGKRRAFTAVELLAATALAAALMLVVVRVIGSIGRAQRDVAAGPSDAWKADLLDTLRRDLANARDVRPEGGRLVITGVGSLDRDTLSPGHDAVTVVYELRSLAGREWLVRHQSPAPGDSSGGAGWTELLCPDVSAFAVEVQARRAAPAQASEPSRAKPRRRAAPRGGVPARLVVRLTGPGGLRLDEVIVGR